MDGFRRVVSASRLMRAIVSLVSVAALVDAAPITWRGDAQIALREAAATGKPLLIEVGADWCHFCKKMEQETFSNPAIADHVRKCFVPVRIDADSDRAITKQLGVRTFPTTIVLSPQLELLASIKGFRSAQQLRSDLAAICNHEHEAQRGTGLKLSVFDRFCPVTSLDIGVPTKGYRDFHLTYRGFDLFFASEQARSQFAIQPAAIGLSPMACVPRRTLTATKRLWVVGNMLSVTRIGFGCSRPLKNEKHSSSVQCTTWKSYGAERIVETKRRLLLFEMS